jgi:hypothetical protein
MAVVYGYTYVNNWGSWVSMDCAFAILSRFGIRSLLPRRCRKKASRPKLSFLKMAGSHAPITGWFCAPTDSSGLMQFTFLDRHQTPIVSRKPLCTTPSVRN